MEGGGGEGMMRSLQFTILLLLFGIFGLILEQGCSKENENYQSNSYEEMSKTHNSKIEVIKNDLIKIYNPMLLPISELFGKEVFTYHIKNYLVGNLVLFYGTLNDVIEKDGGWLVEFDASLLTSPWEVQLLENVFISGEDQPWIRFVLSCNKEEIEQILVQPRDESRIQIQSDGSVDWSYMFENEFLVVARIEEVRKVKFSIVGEVEDHFADLIIDSTKVFVGKGKLIDLVGVK